MIKVLCWLWKQPKSRTSYDASHVNLWAAMVSRHLAMPHTLACVTDMPEGIEPHIEIITPPGEFIGIETPTWCNGKPNCFRRLAMFRRDAAKTFGERFVSMDLDCVIGGPLDPLFDRKEDLVLFKGTQPNRPYNGSMMLMTAGARPQVHESFNASEAADAGLMFCGSDQSWIGYKLGWNEATWNDADGAYFYGSRYQARKKKIPPRVLFFPGKLKPWDVVHFDKFTGLNYHLDVREAA